MFKYLLSLLIAVLFTAAVVGGHLTSYYITRSPGVRIRSPRYRRSAAGNDTSGADIWNL